MTYDPTECVDEDGYWYPEHDYGVSGVCRRCDAEEWDE